MVVAQSSRPYHLMRLAWDVPYFQRPGRVVEATGLLVGNLCSHCRFAPPTVEGLCYLLVGNLCPHCRFASPAVEGLCYLLGPSLQMRLGAWACCQEWHQA